MDPLLCTSDDMNIDFGKLPVGGIYYLHLYPGNVYQKVSEKRAVFVKNRHNDKWNGCEVMPGGIVQRQPLGYDATELLAGDEEDLLAVTPKGRKVVKTSGKDLLSTPDDLLR